MSPNGANPAAPPQNQAEEEQSPLQRFGRDLTEMAEQNKLDPVIGRDEEIRRVIQVLSRRTKNNPVLIASRASARLRSSRAWRGESSLRMCPSHCASAA